MRIHVVLFRERFFFRFISLNGPLGLAILFCGSLVPHRSAAAQISVWTQHYDNARTGQNTNETILTLSNVNSTTFGRLFTYAVDGYVYAQPLYVPNVTIVNKGAHNVLFVATEHDSIYAFDADDGSGTNAAPLWQVSFIHPAAGLTHLPQGDWGTGAILPGNRNNATPGHATQQKNNYVEGKTKESGSYRPRLHAFDG